MKCISLLYGIFFWHSLSKMLLTLAYNHECRKIEAWRLAESFPFTLPYNLYIKWSIDIYRKLDAKVSSLVFFYIVFWVQMGLHHFIFFMICCKFSTGWLRILCENDGNGCYIWKLNFVWKWWKWMLYLEAVWNCTNFYGL